MEKQIAELITQYTGEIYENYSGRGMFGEQTTGVVVDSQQDFQSALIDAIADTEGEEKQQLTTAAKKFKSDNLGKQFIYY